MPVASSCFVISSSRHPVIRRLLSAPAECAGARPAETRWPYLLTQNTLRSRTPQSPTMTAATPRLQGVFSPVLTPFNADYTPDADRFIRHCRWLLDQEVGLAIFGTNSEANSMSVAEK